MNATYIFHILQALAWLSTLDKPWIFLPFHCLSLVSMYCPHFIVWTVRPFCVAAHLVQHTVPASVQDQLQLRACRQPYLRRRRAGSVLRRLRHHLPADPRPSRSHVRGRCQGAGPVYSLVLVAWTRRRAIDTMHSFVSCCGPVSRSWSGFGSGTGIQSTGHVQCTYVHDLVSYLKPETVKRDRIIALRVES